MSAHYSGNGIIRSRNLAQTEISVREHNGESDYDNPKRTQAIPHRTLLAGRATARPASEMRYAAQDETVAYFTAYSDHTSRVRAMCWSGRRLPYLQRGHVDEFYPDGLVAKGVSDPQGIIWRNGYVISEVGKPPDFVLEVASRSAGRRDYTVKREAMPAMVCANTGGSTRLGRVSRRSAWGRQAGRGEV